MGMALRNRMPSCTASGVDAPRALEHPVHSNSELVKVLWELVLNIRLGFV